jgi:hypothetical protein
MNRPSGLRQRVSEEVKDRSLKLRDQAVQEIEGWGILGASAHCQLLDCQMSNMPRVKVLFDSKILRPWE